MKNAERSTVNAELRKSLRYCERLVCELKRLVGLDQQNTKSVLEKLQLEAFHRIPLNLGVRYEMSNGAR